jgi:hypothetical protein
MSNENIRGRYAEEKAKSTDQANKAETAYKPKPRLFVRLPRELATHPPIRHRGEHDLAKLDVMEFVIAGTIAGSADVEVAAQQHAHSYRAGRRAMNDSEGMMKSRYPHRDPGSDKQDAGFHGYHRASKKFEAPSTVTITVSARQLFRWLSLKGLNRLPAILHRLGERGFGGLPPLLRGISKAGNGRWVLDVDTRWTPTSQGLCP